MRRLLAVLVGLAAVLVAVSAAGAGRPGYAWHDTPTGTTDHFRGLSAVSANTAWVSGYLVNPDESVDGKVLRTTDRGATWQDVTPPGSAGLQFRDIEAFGANRAVAMSIGDNPTDFRMYVTKDGGKTWSITFQNTDPNAFYDCMSFFNRRVGLAVSDPPDGSHFRVIRTTDGGMTWNVTGLQMPAAPGAFGFAASGECLTTNHGHRAWFGGGGAEASIFTSNDRGTTWTKSPTPMLTGASAGINGIAFNGQNRGIAVGGDFSLPTGSPQAFAVSHDGGKTWSLAAQAPTEYRSGVAWVDGHTAIAVGLSGSDVSTDGGATWQAFDTGSLDTVDCARPTACWASGAGGRVAYLVRTHH
ncbi:MAG TPA: hypothetical protein VKB70_04785 [Gaiellaceae bacterium]|nr:hypothetical protein [Gaiellaceae bacterium]